MGDLGKTVTDVDLDRIAREVIGLERSNAFVKVSDLAVITGIKDGAHGFRASHDR